jgi:uncharacterized membrane protein YphA (DoxX/SURF4 family)
MNPIRRFGVAYILSTALNVVLLALALAVAGLYGQDLHRAHQAGKYQDSKWVYAVVVAGLSAVTAILLMIPFFLRFVATIAWSFILFVLWIALFGIFGKMYIHENADRNPDIIRLKRAVWVDLANAIGWLIAAVSGLVYWLLHRERRSRFTGRAKV